MSEASALSHIGGHRVPCYPFPTRWEEKLPRAEWYAHLREEVRNPISLYVHIPFCESLCSFCGCNTSITRDKSWSSRYTDWLLQEWNDYRQHIPQWTDTAFADLRFGGGTPQFLLSEDLERLFAALRLDRRSERSVVTVEVDPRVSTAEQFHQMARWGVTDFEIGVQDLDPQVQRRIHRYQTSEQVARVMETLRSLPQRVRIGWELVYGLPGQSLESWEATLQALKQAQPDRVQVYPFFSVPWIRRQNAESGESALMSTAQKEALSVRTFEFLNSQNFIHLGEGLFVRHEDPLAVAFREGRMHRHFSGLTAEPTSALIGLGTGAISETAHINYQNVKALPVFQRLSERGEDLGLRSQRLNEFQRFIKTVVREAQTRHALPHEFGLTALERQPGLRDYFTLPKDARSPVRFRDPASVALFLHQFLRLSEEQLNQIWKDAALK